MLLFIESQVFRIYKLIFLILSIRKIVNINEIRFVSLGIRGQAGQEFHGIWLP